MRKAAFPLLVFLLAATAIMFTGACGGGGGGGGGGSNGGSGSVTLNPSTATVGPNGQVELIAQQNGTVVDVTWSASAGLVTPTSIGRALFTAPGSGSSTITAALVSDPSRTDSTTVNVTAGLATVRGRVVGSDGGGVAGVQIQFYNGATITNTVSTTAGGYFAVGVNPAATRFHVNKNTISSSYYKQYTYNSLRYTALDNTCTAPLPGALSAGATVVLTTNITLPTTVGPPPPPPNGCQ